MATLYDHEGRPVDTKALREEAIDADSMWLRSSLYRDSVASTLTPQRLAAVLRNAAQGDHEDYLTLAEEVEERELHYRSVLGTRKLAVSGAPVNVEAADDSARATEVADAVRRDIVENDAFQDMLFDLLDGLGKGFSVCEIIWDTSGRRWIPRGYKWRDPRLFTWDASLEEVRLATNRIGGEPLQPFKFIVHRPKLKTGVSIRGGIARPAAVAYMLKSYTVRDWHTFMDVYGHPLRLGRYGKDATPKEIAALRRAVLDIAADAAGIVPDSMQIEFIAPPASAGGDKLFKAAAEWWDKQVSKVVLGQTMTSEDGSSLAQAKVHNDVRLDIAQADARQLTATINRYLVRAYVDLNFGAQERYPAVSISIDAPEDLKALAETVGVLVDRGATVPQWWVREKFGIPEAAPGDEVLGKPAPSPSPASSAPPPAEVEALNRRIEGLELALNRQARTVDQIDRWAAEALEDWEPQLEGTAGRIIDIAQTAVSYEDFLAQIDAASETMSIDAMTRRLAIELFKARSLGDMKDDPRGSV